MDMKRFFLYAIVIAALALAGCGGNGGGGTSGEGGPMMPSSVTIPDLPMGYNSNPAGMFTVAAGATMDNGDVTYTCPSGGDACEIEVADDGTVTSTGGMATAARSTASIAQQTSNERMEAAEVVAATAAAATKLTAIQAEAAQLGNDAGLGGGGGVDSEGTAVPAVSASRDTAYVLTIERDNMGKTVKIMDPNEDFDGVDTNDVANDEPPQFTKAMVDLDKAGGFGGQMLVRVNSDDDEGKVEEVVVVRTDIEAPKATPFGEVAGQILNAEADGTLVDFAADGGPGEGAVAFDPVTITLGTTAPTEIAVLANIRSEAFPAASGDSASYSFDGADEGGDAGTDGFEAEGFYNGADGIYKCVGSSDCTVSVNSDGGVTAFSDGWIFVPAENATSSVQDADYLYYGFWLKRTTKDGATTYNEVETYFGSQMVAETQDGNTPSDTPATSGIGLVTDGADYTGNATGVYVRNVTDSQGAIETATSGVFSADVELNANFGGGDVGVDKQFLISGKVTGFKLEHGEVNDWSVTLKDADFAPGRTTDGNPPSDWVNTFSGVTEGDPGRTAGAWNGAFYGPAAVADGDDADTNADPTAPPHVLGEFGANFTDGAVAGAFGANKDE